MTPEQKTNFEKIKQAALQATKVTGLPVVFIAAQCALETGWLKHTPGNNCFGIKSYPGAFGRQLLNTREWFSDAEHNQFVKLGDGRTAEPVEPAQYDHRGKRLYHVQDWFATFQSLGDCFAKHVKLFTQGRYATPFGKLLSGGSLETFVRAIAPVYATDPGYADSLLSMIDQVSRLLAT